MTSAPHRPDHHLENQITTAGLLILMAGLLALIGWVVLGAQGVGVALGLGIGYLLVGLRASPEFIMQILGAKRLSRNAAPAIYALVDALESRARLTEPLQLYVLSAPVMQSFTAGTGGRRACIAVSEKLLAGLTLAELAGVLAHEIGHVANRDLTVLRFADLLTGLTRSMALAGLLLLIFSVPLYLQGGGFLPVGILLLLIFSPALSTIIQLAVSRTREFAADERAADILGEAEGLASALNKIEADHDNLLWVRGYLPSRRPPELSLLRSHPLTEERIRRLSAIEPTFPPLPIEEIVLPAVNDRSASRWKRFWPWF